MSYIDEMLSFNKQFVSSKQYVCFSCSGRPEKKIAILACMDTRLVEILPAALNFKNGDVILIKNAGARISHPFGSIMRSLLIAVYELGVEHILVIGHHDCKVEGMTSAGLVQKMASRNIPQEKIDFIEACGVNIDKWLKGFESVEKSIEDTVKTIKHHPLFPCDIDVRGFIMNPSTGKLDEVKTKTS